METTEGVVLSEQQVRFTYFNLLCSTSGVAYWTQFFITFSKKSFQELVDQIVNNYCKRL